MTCNSSRAVLFIYIVDVVPYDTAASDNAAAVFARHVCVPSLAHHSCNCIVIPL